MIMNVNDLYEKLESFVKIVTGKMVKSELRSNYLVSRMPVIIARYDINSNSASIIIPTDSSTATEYFYPNRSGDKLSDGQKAYLVYQSGNVSQGWLETNSSMKIIPDPAPPIPDIDMKKIVNTLYPVGCVITNGDINFDPNIKYEDTAWVRIKGRVIVGVDEEDEDFNVGGKTGGNKEMQKHSHNVFTNKNSPVTYREYPHSTTISLDESEGATVRVFWSVNTEIIKRNVGLYGAGESENLQPYIASYIWKRIS